MKERGKLTEEFRKLSPLELNQRLQKIFDSVPYNFTDYPELSQEEIDKIKNLSEEEKIQIAVNSFMEYWRKPESKEEFERRYNSEFKTMLTYQLVALLDFAIITSSFREQIIQEFSGHFTAGRPKKRDSYIDNKMHHFLDLADSESSGIFDKERAKEIERKGFQRRVKEIEIGEKTIGNKYPGLFQMFRNDLKNWEEEFFLLHEERI